MQETTSGTADPLFHTSDPALLKMWDEIQTLQADFAIAQELPSYYRSEHWYQADSVLDLGTGNGHYLGLIANVFPNKRYTGIDNSDDLIQIAKQRVKAPNIEFRLADVFTDLNDQTEAEKRETWDYVIARLFFQHMPIKDLTKILRILAQITKPGACVVILDAYDSMRLFVPPVPEFMDLFGAYTMDQHDKGMERDVTALIESRVRVLREWHVIDRTQICVPSSIPGNLERFCRAYALMIEIIGRVGEIPVTESVKTAWHHWREGILRYTQVGLNILILQRQSDKLG